jgi:hypothetical protein
MIFGNIVCDLDRDGAFSYDGDVQVTFDANTTNVQTFDMKNLQVPKVFQLTQARHPIDFYFNGDSPKTCHIFNTTDTDTNAMNTQLHLYKVPDNSVNVVAPIHFKIQCNKKFTLEIHHDHTSPLQFNPFDSVGVQIFHEFGSIQEKHGTNFQTTVNSAIVGGPGFSFLQTLPVRAFQGSVVTKLEFTPKSAGNNLKCKTYESFVLNSDKLIELHEACKYS